MKQIFSLFIMMLFLAGCDNIRKASETNIYKVAPSDTTVLLKIKSISSVYKNFGIKKNKYNRLSRDLRKIKKKLKFNFDDISELERIGVNINGSCAFGMSKMNIVKRNKDPRFILYFLIPSDQPSRVMKNMKDILTSSVSKKNLGEFKKYKKMEYVTNPKRQNSEFVFFAQSGKYLIAGFSNKKSLEEVYTFISSKTTVYDTTGYKNLQNAIDFNEDIVFYTDIKNLLTKQIMKTAFAPTRRYSSRRKSPYMKRYYKRKEDEQKRMTKLVEDYLGMAFTMKLESKDLVFNGALSVKENSPILKIYKYSKNVESVLNIEKNPIFLMISGFNVQSYMDYMRTLFNKKAVKNLEDIYKSSFGLDLEKDLVNNLSGSVNLGFFDGKTFTKENFNAVLTIGVKDERKMQTVWNRIIDKFKMNLEKARIKREERKKRESDLSDNNSSRRYRYRRKKSAFSSAAESLKVENVRVNGVDCYKISTKEFEVYTAVHNKSLIIAQGKTIFKQALSGTVERSFTTKMTKPLAKMIKTNDYIMYLNFNEISKAMLNFYSMARKPKDIRDLNQIRKILSNFQYISSDSQVNGNIMSGSFILKTNYKENFIPATIKLFKSLK